MIYDIVVKDRKGNDVSLSDYKGKVLLIVNTATGCGFTPQYEGLENLYREYKDKGLEILDFPCDQFGHQAPGSDEEINEFCTARYDTTFPRFKKIEVNGDNKDSLWAYIEEKAPYKAPKGLKNSMTMKSLEKFSGTSKNPSEIRWNFTKFLVDREGNVVNRFEPIVEPKDIEEEVKKYI